MIIGGDTKRPCSRVYVVGTVLFNFANCREYKGQQGVPYGHGHAELNILHRKIYSACRELSLAMHSNGKNTEYFYSLYRNDIYMFNTSRNISRIYLATIANRFTLITRWRPFNLRK